MLVAYEMLWLFVTDVQNDMIAFSSDDELMEAVKNVSDGILHVFIHEKPPAASSVPEPLHVVVTSDAREFHLNFHTLYSYSCRDVEFFLRDFLLAHCVYNENG